MPEDLLITVDRQRCCGYTLCAAEAPAVYSIDDEGYAVAPPRVPAALAEQARRGAEACPDRAITITCIQPEVAGSNA